MKIINKLQSRKQKRMDIDIDKRFELRERIGEGTYAYVYRALDKTIGKVSFHTNIQNSIQPTQCNVPSFFDIQYNRDGI